MKTIKTTVIHIGWQKREGGVWLPPERAAKYFRNGRGIALGSLMNKLRAGKLQDIAFQDAFGWWVFIPDTWIEKKFEPLKAA